MNKNQIKLFIITIFFGFFWSILLFVSALVIKNFTGNPLKNLIFAEGIMFIFFSMLSAITGNSLGSLHTKFDQNDYEYLSNIALETRNLSRKTILINNLKLSLNMVSLLLGEVFSLFLSFIFF